MLTSVRRLQVMLKMFYLVMIVSANLQIYFHHWTNIFLLVEK